MLHKFNWKKLFVFFFLMVSLSFLMPTHAKAAQQTDNTIIMYVGETYTIKTDYDVKSWSSNIPGTVFVDESSGTLSAEYATSTGATITATLTNGSTLSYNVKVIEPFFQKESYSVTQNSDTKIYFDKKYGTVVATIADPSIAEVYWNDYYSRLEVTGIIDGVTLLTVQTDLGTFQTSVTVNSAFTFDRHSSEVERGETIELEMDDSFSSYKWSISDESIATLEKCNPDKMYRRNLVALKAGTVEITVENELGQIAKTTVEVTADPFYIGEVDGPFDPGLVVPVSLCTNANESYSGDSSKLELPKYYWDDCTYVIEDESIVSLKSYTGSVMKIYGKKAGDTTITVTNKWGETVYCTVHVYDKITNLSIDKKEFDVFLGQTVKIPYTYDAPSSNHNNYMYFGYDDGKLSISDAGIVTPKVAGRHQVYIWAESPDNKTYDYCFVNVHHPYFAQSTYSIYKNHTVALQLVGASSASNWTSSNPSVATVNSSGVVTGIKKGSATISATVNGVRYSTTVNVNNPTLSATKLTLFVKNTNTLKVTGGVGTVKWSSSNKKIAKVDSKGKITAVKAGSATITATVSGEKLTCKVTVKKPALSATKKTLKVSQSFKLVFQGGSGKIKWKSSNSKIAKVDSKGKVTALKKGTVTITAKRNGYTSKCKITVKPNQKTYSVSKNVHNYRYGEPQVRLSKVYYSGNTLKADIYVLNNRRFTADKFSYINFNIYDNNGKVIAKKKFKNVKLNMKPYSYKKITLTYSGSALKQKGVILSNGVSYDWNYWYTYTIR